MQESVKWRMPEPGAKCSHCALSAVIVVRREGGQEVALCAVCAPSVPRWAPLVDDVQSCEACGGTADGTPMIQDGRQLHFCSNHASSDGLAMAEARIDEAVAARGSFTKARAGVYLVTTAAIALGLAWCWINGGLMGAVMEMDGLVLLVSAVLLVLFCTLSWAYVTACPVCKRCWARELVDEDELRREDGYKTVRRRDVISNRSGRTIGYRHRREQVHVVRITTEKFWHCTRCDHEWSTEHVSEREG